MIIEIVAAIADNTQVIGRNGKIPWRIKTDLANFHKLTNMQWVVMGRNTWESLPQKPLSNRGNIVITTQKHPTIEGAAWVDNIESAMGIFRFLTKHSSTEQKLMVIGGARVYHDFLPLAQVMHITHVHAHIEGDVYFPQVNWNEWKAEESKDYKASEKDDYPFTIVRYVRI